MITLGAQLFSLRKAMKTPEETKETFLKVKEIGYENVQLSGAPYMEADVIRQIVDETGMEIVLTHTPLDRIIGETDKVIEEHKKFGCPVIGLGCMPKECQNSLEEAMKLVESLQEPAKKIEAAGLKFAYHNHAFEFLDLVFEDGSNIYDYMLSHFPTWQFILDTYWVQYAGKDVCDYMRKAGGDRLTNVHFKDMANSRKRSIVACGTGVLDFEKIYACCKEIGVKHILVEQDNAVDMPDPFEQMEIGFNNLRPIIK